MEEKKSLSQFKKGDKVRVLSVNCGRTLSRRLSDLGLFEETEIEIIKNDDFGPIIVKILNSKIALGRGEAIKIYGEKI
ncbi:ferrous iron transport protein A [bacterium]|nr:ferrous iron transport protein A [bacterium]